MRGTGISMSKESGERRRSKEKAEGVEEKGNEERKIDGERSRQRWKRRDGEKSELGKRYGIRKPVCGGEIKRR